MQKYYVEVNDDIDSNGEVLWWYKFGTNILHRKNGPAVVWPNGTRGWFQNGLKHRLDGPAVVWSYGKEEYWIEGIQYSFEDWQKKVQELQNPTCHGKVVEIEDKKYKLIEIE